MYLEEISNAVKTHQDLFWKNFEEYVRHLNRIDTYCSVRSAKKLKKEFSKDKEFSDFYIAYDDDCNAVGLAIIGKDYNCHPSADIYISDFYIFPGCQKKYNGLDLLKKLIHLYDAKRICMYVLNKNIDANVFWNTVFTKIGWKNVSYQYPMEMGDIPLTPKMYEKEI